MAKKQCVQCEKPKGLVSVNYAGKTVYELGGSMVTGHENYDFTLPGSKNDDYLCSDCASQVDLTCKSHGLFKSAMSAGVMKPCTECVEAKSEQKAEEKAAKVAAAEAEKEAAQAKEAEIQERLEGIPVTTGDVRWDYEIDRVIFNIGASSGMLGNFVRASPDAAFRQAELSLKYQAAELNCDAVVHTQFEHRVFVEKGIAGHNQGIEVFAYGTAVRRK